MKDELRTLTVLTDPVPIGFDFVSEHARKIFRKVRGLIKKPDKKLNNSKYRGHFAVTRSLVEGLSKSGLPHNYAPKSLQDISETVVVLAGVRTLRQAISLKKKGRIKRLLAGPNIVVFASDEGSIIADDQIDLVVTPCQWVIDVYSEDHASIGPKGFAWPAGVDTEYWKPNDNVRRDQILIFEKQNKGPVGPVQPYADYLRDQGFKVSILQYGNFTHTQYLAELQKSMLMIGFVTDESQGIAWAEAWSVDVPTLIWRNTTNTYKGRKYKCSTAPYLCDQNGAFFDDLEHFKTVLTQWTRTSPAFSARTWTLENMSDEVCAKRIFKKAIVW